MKYVVSVILLLLSFCSFGFTRAEYGVWQELSHSCLNTRSDLLVKSGSKVTITTDCKILSGTWTDAYTGKILSHSAAIDIDHVIPLKYADDNGASRWPIAKKKAFANDSLNLRITSNHLNRSKGGKGPARWLPPSASEKCPYLNAWKVVSEKYGLVLQPSDLIVIKTCEKEGKK